MLPTLIWLHAHTRHGGGGLWPGAVHTPISASAFPVAWRSPRSLLSSHLRHFGGPWGAAVGSAQQLNHFCSPLPPVDKAWPWSDGRDAGTPAPRPLPRVATGRARRSGLWQEMGGG